MNRILSFILVATISFNGFFGSNSNFTTTFDSPADAFDYYVDALCIKETYSSSYEFVALSKICFDLYDDYLSDLNSSSVNTFKNFYTQEIPSDPIGSAVHGLPQMDKLFRMIVASSKISYKLPSSLSQLWDTWKNYTFNIHSALSSSTFNFWKYIYSNIEINGSSIDINKDLLNEVQDSAKTNNPYFMGYSYPFTITNLESYLRDSNNLDFYRESISALNNLRKTYGNDVIFIYATSNGYVNITQALDFGSGNKVMTNQTKSAVIHMYRIKSSSYFVRTGTYSTGGTNVGYYNHNWSSSSLEDLGCFGFWCKGDEYYVGPCTYYEGSANRLYLSYGYYVNSPNLTTLRTSGSNPYQISAYGMISKADTYSYCATYFNFTNNIISYPIFNSLDDMKNYTLNTGNYFISSTPIVNNVVVNNQTFNTTNYEVLNNTTYNVINNYVIENNPNVTDLDLYIQSIFNQMQVIIENNGEISEQNVLMLQYLKNIDANLEEVKNFLISGDGSGSGESVDLTETNGLLSSIAYKLDQVFGTNYGGFSPLDPNGSLITVTNGNGSKQINAVDFLLPLVYVVFLVIILFNCLSLVLSLIGYLFHLINIPAYTENLEENFIKAFQFLRGELPEDNFYIFQFANFNVTIFDFMVLIFEIAFIGTSIMIVKNFIEKIEIPEFK